MCSKTRSYESRMNYFFIIKHLRYRYSKNELLASPSFQEKSDQFFLAKVFVVQVCFQRRSKALGFSTNVSVVLPDGRKQALGCQKKTLQLILEGF